MKTPWEIYKEKRESGVATPIDFVMPGTQYASQEEKDARYDICQGCERFAHSTKQCKECGCFMAIKTKLQHATCPLGKW
jgi:hypothetical protein